MSATQHGGADEVDAVVEAWGRARPDLSFDSMEIWSRIARLSGILDGHRRRAFSGHDVEGWEFDVLAALRRSDPPHRLSPGQLLRETHVTSGTMTNRVDRLVRRGLVTRESDPNDGRGVLVAITAEGSALVDAAMTELLALEKELLSDWSPAERNLLAAMLRRLLLASA